MSPLMKALKKGKNTNLEAIQRSILVITCPDICHYPKVLRETTKNVFYSQNVYNFLLGISDSDDLTTLWENIQASITLYKITDVVFLAHYPCSVLENIHQLNLSEVNLSPAVASVFSKIKGYIASNIRTTNSVSRALVCQLFDTNRKAFESHLAIKELLGKEALNIHSWLYDREEEQTYLYSIDKDSMVSLSKIE